MRNEIVIAAPASRIYEYAHATEKWGEYLPHYRYVRVLEDDSHRRLVEMAAWRSGIPVRWRAEQINDGETPAIHFHHTAGWTKGMDVEWQFEAVPGGTRVSIEHTMSLRQASTSFGRPFNYALRAPFRMTRKAFERWVIGGFFIHHIAEKTLRRMKELAEK